MFDYRYDTFLTLCQEKSYTATADKLFITQPAVSQHIKWLETTYNCKLINYEHRNVLLTAKGQFLYDSLIKLNAQIKRVENELSTENYAPKKMNFAATLSIADDLLPDILVKFTKIKPNLQIACLVENTETILNRLRNGSLDFALIEGNFPKDEFAFELLATQPFVAVTHETNYSKISKNCQLADLLNIPLITREPGSGSRQLLENLLAEQNYSLKEFKQVLEIGSLKAVKVLLQENMGIAFLYQGVVKDELANGSLKQLTIQNMSLTHNFYFIYLKDSLFDEELLKKFKLIQSFLA